MFILLINQAARFGIDMDEQDEQDKNLGASQLDDNPRACRIRIDPPYNGQLLPSCSFSLETQTTLGSVSFE